MGKAIKASKNNPMPALILARYYNSKKQYANALTVIEDMPADAKKSIDVLNVAALANFQLGNYSGSRDRAKGYTGKKA